MSRRDFLQVLEYAVKEVIHVCLAHIVTCDNDCADCDGRYVIICPVSLFRNDIPAVVRRLYDELPDMFVIESDEIDFLC